MNLLQTDSRKIRILHLDDHMLFLTAIRRAILGYYPNAIIEEFPTNAKALSRLTECIQFNMTPDLIITDYNHPGNNGLEFAQNAKLLGEKHGMKIPIIMITMVSMEVALPDGLEDSPLNGYLPKASSAEDILDLIGKVIP